MTVPRLSDCKQALWCGANIGGRHDVFAAMRLVMTLPHTARSDFNAWPSASKVLSAATEGDAFALGIGKYLGRIAPGELADLLLVRVTSAGMVSAVPSVDSMVQ
jgi:cytosine/adenosine deaminase-related metal-dependent hydrolase